MTGILAFDSTALLLDKLIMLLKGISNSEMLGAALERESYSKILAWLENLYRELNKHGYKIGFDTLEKLFSDFISKERLPFEGSLDSPVQLTGILETRLMDYDELYVLSCNEGIWPAESSAASLIPYSIRKAFSLPTREFSDSFYGYYFYRLLNRAEKVHLMYVNSPDPSKMSQGEPSRFIQQLRYDSDQKCMEYVLASSVRPGKAGEKSVSKTGVIHDVIQEYLLPRGRKTLSPSALNTYIDCPLKFALQYVLGIREEDDFTEAGEPRMFGILMHKSLENLYGEFEKSGRLVSREFLEGVLKDREKIRSHVINSFRTEYFKKLSVGKMPELFGKDLLVEEVLQKHFSSVVMHDLAYAPFSIISLEKWLQGTFSFNYSGSQTPVRIGGYIDRVDLKGDVTRILDYKTGNPVIKFRVMEEVFDPGKGKRPKEILQALLYCFIYQQNKSVEKLMPAIYPTGRMRGKSFDPGIVMDGRTIDDVRVFKEDFEIFIGNILEELFNSDIPFRQTEYEDNCRYCPFSDYCGR
jgi:hypothetical protein